MGSTTNLFTPNSKWGHVLLSTSVCLTVCLSPFSTHSYVRPNVITQNWPTCKLVSHLVAYSLQPSIGGEYVGRGFISFYYEPARYEILIRFCCSCSWKQSRIIAKITVSFPIYLIPTLCLSLFTHPLIPPSQVVITSMKHFSLY